MLIVATKSDGTEWVRERKFSDSSWERTVKAVAAGEWTDLSQIRRFDTGEIVTHLIAEEVARIWADRDEPLKNWQMDFLKAGGVIRVRKFAEAAE